MPAPARFSPAESGVAECQGPIGQGGPRVQTVGFELSGRVSRWSFAVPRTTAGGESGVGRAASGLNEVRHGGRRQWTRCRRGRCWRSDHVGNRLGGGTPSIHICSQFRAGSVRQKPPFKSREPRRQVGRSIVGGCVCHRRPSKDKRREGVAVAAGRRPLQLLLPLALNRCWAANLTCRRSCRLVRGPCRWSNGGSARQCMSSSCLSVEGLEKTD